MKFRHTKSFSIVGGFLLLSVVIRLYFFANLSLLTSVLTSVFISAVVFAVLAVLVFVAPFVFSRILRIFSTQAPVQAQIQASSPTSLKIDNARPSFSEKLIKNFKFENSETSIEEVMKEKDLAGLFKDTPKLISEYNETGDRYKLDKHATNILNSMETLAENGKIVQKHRNDFDLDEKSGYKNYIPRRLGNG